MTRNEQAYLKLGISKAITGSTLVVGKIITASFPVFLASGLRLAIASAILMPLLLKQERGLPSIPRRDLIILFFQALAGVFAFSIALLYGLRLTTAIESGVITSTTPAIVGLLSFFFLKEKLNWRISTGIMLSVIGVLAMSVLGSQVGHGRGPEPLLGNLLIFGAVIGEALFIALGKIASEEVTPLTITAYISFFGFLLFMPFSTYEALTFDFSKVAFADWTAILYYGVVATAFSLILWHQGIAKETASIAAVFTSFIPISALILSFVFLKEPLYWNQMVGMLFVVFGVAFIAKEPNEEGNLKSFQEASE